MGIKLGNIDVSYFKVGSGDCTIYLGNTLLYPTTPPSYKFQATYSGGQTYSEQCDSSTELTSASTKPSGYVASAMTTAVVGVCITSLGTDTFRDCSGLTSITLPSELAIIGENAIRSCTSLSSITIPNSVTSISDSTFRYCTGLTSCTIGSGVTSIGNHVFEDCESLTSVTIPDSVTSIGFRAFRNCSSFTSITIPSGVTSIDSNAFQGCSSLTSITVNAVTPPTLGSNAFDNTNNCPIYVPSQSLEAYKSASGWSNYASRIQPIQ